MSDQVMSKEQFLDKYATLQAGEIVLLMAGEYDSYTDFALVRVLCDANMREWADHYIQTHRIHRWPMEPSFHCGDFVMFLESNGVLERMQYRHLDVADDTDCTLASPMPDSYVDESQDPHSPMAYEVEEMAFDPSVKN